MKYDALPPEAKVLAQAIHDMRTILGYDNDGDPTPAADINGVGLGGYVALALRDAEDAAAALADAEDAINGLDA